MPYYIRVVRAYILCVCNNLIINTLFNNSSYVAISGTNAAQAAERLYRTKTSGGRRGYPQADD